VNRAVLPLAGTVVGLVVVLGYRTTPLPGATTTVGAAAPVGAASRTLTGDPAQTRWGPVQVAVVLSGDRITQVTVLQSPNGNRHDVEIGSYAMPRLQAQTLQVQSADVDVVSGATYTSEGYRTSLQSALDQR